MINNIIVLVFTKKTIMSSSSANVMFGDSLTFDHRTKEWGIFKSRFVQYCTANNIDNETDKLGVKRRALLLTALVEDTYRVVRDLAFPSDLESITYVALLKLLDAQFVPKKSTFAERYKFYKAEQRVGEDLAEWAARVRNLAQYCGFRGDLDAALRDRFVLGLESIKEKEKLFAESVDDLTFSRALELAQSVRCARQALQATQAEQASAAAAAPALYALRASSRATAATRGTRVSDNSEKQCQVCGYKNHSKEKCRFSNYSCKVCNQKGHLRRMCKSRMQNNNYLAADDSDTVEGTYDLFNIKSINGNPMRQMVTIANSDIECEIDSGSAVSVLPQKIYQTHFSQYELKTCKIVLNCYNGTKITPLGCLLLPVSYEGMTRSINIFVIATHYNQPALLGRDFISSFKLQLCSADCNNLQQDNCATIIREKYAKLFSNELGTFNKYKIHLKVKPDVELRFFKPRPVPLALKSKVEEELKRQVDLGILEKVDHAEIATPIVPVLRPDGNVRICGDYSVTLNKVLFMDNYPLPRIEDLFAKLHGGEEFSKLDLSRAYNQLELDDSKNLTCINTHKGLFRYNRLVFGLCNAPFIFQQTMENLIGDIEGTCIFLDDILVTGENRQIHIDRLEKVLQRLEEAGLRLKQDKCELFKESVEYLGFIIDKNGLRKSQQKVEAILNCKSPKTVSELKSFLGMVNYYRCFVPNTSSVLSPLHLLLQKGVKWEWGDNQEKAFHKIKEELTSDRVLAHYNPELPIVVTSDAGPEGLGAVLAQKQADGTERAIAYASRSLSKAERNYAQIQKEATSIVFAVKKFHHYLYGRTVPFILRTDHKPLIIIFGNKKGVPELAANRLQRYALFLSAYNFNIEYVKGEHNVADFLSRSTSNKEIIESVKQGEDRSLYINYISDSMLTPITMKDVEVETERDPVLNRIVTFLKTRMPAKCNEEILKPYFACRSELSLENGCILRGHKLVIPSKFREQLLEELHSSHFGVVKTKAEARSRMWWPNIDKHIEEKIGSCSVCNTLRAAPPRSPLAPWPHPERPWERVHIDMFTLFGNQFLVVVDAHSKWTECNLMQKTDSAAVVEKLGEIFSRFGLVRTLISDNASNFVSNEFQEFCRINGIKHITSAPYHPASNGQAENSVKTIKKGLKVTLQANDSNSKIQKKINKFLFDYRNSIHCTTGFSPAQLMFGRPLRCRFDLLRNQVSNNHIDSNSIMSNPSTAPLSTQANINVSSKQISQCEQYGGKRNTSFSEGDRVLVKHFYNNGNKHTWKTGIIKKKVGTRMFEVFIPEININVKKHVDHLLAYKGSDQLVHECDDDFTYYDCTDVITASTASSELQEPRFEREGDSGENRDDAFVDCSSDDGTGIADESAEQTERRYPLRSTRNPNPLYVA